MARQTGHMVRSRATGLRGSSGRGLRLRWRKPRAVGWRPIAVVLVQAMVGSLLAVGLPVAGPQVSVASEALPASPEDETAPAEDGTQSADTEPANTADDASDEETTAAATVEDESADETADEVAPDEASREESSDQEVADDGDEADGERSDGQEDTASGDSESVEADGPTFAPLSANPPNTYIRGQNIFYAYVEAGETLDVLFTKVDWPGASDDTFGAELTIEGPGGEVEECVITAPADPGDSCQFTGLTSATSGVWRIEMLPIGGAGGGTNRYSWEINVNNGGGAVDGRVWTELYQMQQFSGDLSEVASFDLWYQSEQGYLYEATYADFHSINSNFRADGTGVRDNGTCTSAYASIVAGDQQGETPDPDRSEADLGECGDPYKIFFDEPAADLPAEATRWDGTTDWIAPEPVEPTITDVTFTPDGVEPRSGTIDYEVENFAGQLVVEIDTDNDGVYDVTIPGSVVGGAGSVDFDGLDGNGDPVSALQDMGVRVSIDQIGEIHFTNFDVEVRGGGLEVVALNGPNAGDATLYWNDTELSTTALCGDPTPVLDGRGGVDSTGGVHGWDVDACPGPGLSGGWGDGRIIDDWTFATTDEELGITIPGEELPPFECAPGAPGMLFQAPDGENTNVELVDIVTGESDTAFTIDDRAINAVAYNVLDDYVYGWDISNEVLVRVGADGVVEELPTDLPVDDTVFTEYNMGEIDENGQYWVTRSNSDTWYQVDLAPGSATYGQVVDSGPFEGGGVEDLTAGADWAFVPGGGDYLYRIMTDADNDEFVLIGFNRGTGEFENVGSLGDLGFDDVASGFGAVYADPAGFLYGSHNQSGQIVRVDVQAVTGGLFADGPPSGQNDGARCFLSPIPIDFGDAAEGYGTLLDDAGPRHRIPDYDTDTNTAPLMLGELVDIETDGIPSTGADGDDADNVADEDGVADPILMATGQETTVSVSATNDTNEDAILAGWIDLDGSGTFDPGELVIGDPVPAGSGLDSYELTFPVGTVTADTYARFRLFPGDTDQADILPTGPASAGEVEDYTVTFLALDVDKTSDATEDSRIGDTVTYTVTLTNNGTADYTAANAARYRDDLTGVLDDATLDEGSLSSDRSEQPTFDDPFIDWVGALPAGESVTITYEVELTGDGDGVVRNVAFVPPCDPEDPACDAVTPECDPPDENGRDPQTGLPCAENEFELPRLEIDKTADTTELPAVGETVTYTVVAENVGPGDYTPTAPALVTDDLTEVLDDATFDQASLTANPPGTLDFNDPIVSWEGVLAANESVTIEYTVTYTGEGDQILTNEACVPEDEAAPGAEPCDSVEIPGAFIVDDKSVSASDDPVEAGTVLTYTLTFENEGEAAGTVDKFDDLNHVLDDGDLTAGPTPSDAALTATGPDGDNRIHITGTLDPDQVVTVTYEVTVKPDGERGDNAAANFLVEPGEPPLCDPGDPDCDVPPCEESDEDCTETLIPEIEDDKSVQASDDPVEAGTVLTYTLTFENVGEAAGTVDKFDDLNHVLDDGDLTAGPTASDAALSVSGPDGDNRLHITGDLDPDQVVTVTYEITVKPDGERGDNQAVNVLVDPGTDPLCDPADPDCDPPECEDSNEDCTETLIPEIVDEKDVQASDDPVVEGTVLTYTLTFENVGEAAGEVDRFDDLTHVLDDADLTDGPTASDATLSVSGPDGNNRLHITGSLDPDQTVTVTYEVTVKPDGERGDNRAVNLLVDPGEPPLCDPADPDCEVPVCEESDEDCTETLIPEIVDYKEVDPASMTPVTAGEELTYTLTFTNEGAAAGDVDRVDDLSHILDDADLIDGPDVSDAALSVSGPDGDDRIAITGELDPDQTVTVTYTVRVRETGERGDDVLANFLVDPDEEPPSEPECEPAEGELPDCTINPVGDIKPSKSVDPESGTEVEVGEELTYTVTFENVGQGAGEVDYTDHAAGVFDDADLIDGPTVSGSALTASGPDGDDQIHITGTLTAGQSETVTYTVRVRDHDEQGDHHLVNFVTLTGEDPPDECAATNPLCTENPVEDEKEQPKPGKPKLSLPHTGTSVGLTTLAVALVMLTAGLAFVAIAYRRRQNPANEHTVGIDDLL